MSIMNVAGRKGLLVCVCLLTLGGCASFKHRPPSCDGTARRPLNSSLNDSFDPSSSAPLGLKDPPATAMPIKLSANVTSKMPLQFAGERARDKPSAIRTFENCGEK